MIFKKIIKSTVCAVFAATVAISAFSGCAVQDTRAAVTVNDEEISQKQYGYYFSMIQQQMLSEAGVSASDADAVENFWKNTEIDGENALTAARNKAKDEAVKMAVRVQKAKELGVELTDEDKQSIKDNIDTIIKNNGGREEYEKQLAAINTDAKTFEELFSNSQLISKLEQKLEDDGKLKVTDEEVKQYLTDNYVKAKHILFATMDLSTKQPYDDEKKASVKKTAEKILDEINNGGDFDALMKQYSEDTGLEQNPDGYVFTKGEMVQQFEDAAFALKPGEISELVESQFGFHIIKREPFTVTDENVSQYASDAETKILSEKFDSMTDKWTKKANVKVNESVLKKFKYDSGK